MKTQIENYEEARIGVDAVIFTIKDQQLHVYLNTREKEPFNNKKELLGGLLRANETAEETLERKLKELSNGNEVYFQQFYTFTSPNRDPRERTISIGFVALLAPDNSKDSENFYNLNNLPELAFDHKEIITKAFEYLQQNIGTQILKQFMPKTFPLNDLQIIHELITKKKSDNRNFRKKILDSGIVKKAKEVQKNVSHRPATLYQFVD